MPDPYLLYLRKSVGYAGISRQRTSTEDHLARRGACVPDGGEFRDEDKTAFRSTRDDIDAPLPPRPGFDAMLAELARRPGAGIAAWHIDRLARDPEAAEILIRACRKGSHLITTTRGGDYDASTANGRARIRDDINRATHEVDHNVERLIEAKAEAAALGKWLGGPRPFGWQPAGEGRLELDEREAELIARASADVLAGVPLRAIARQWAAAGIPGAQGGAQWTSSTVRKVLIRARNAGLAEHRGQIVPLEDGPAWKPIVPEETWRGVRAILTNPERRSHDGTAAAHLLTGIALCGGCGITVVGAKSAQGTPRYRCGRAARQLGPHPGPHASRTMADVDALITYLAIGRLAMDDAVMLLRADRGAERETLLARETGITGRRDEQWRLYQAGVITDIELTQGRRQLRAELEEVRAQLSAIEEGDALAPFLPGRRDATLAGRREAVAARWEGALLEQQRAAVAALMYVTLMPGALYSRPPGWQVGDGQFDPRLVDVRWVRRLPSDG